MKTIFGRHHIRANFYHFVSALYVLTMILWGLDIMSGMAATWIGFALFVADYIAQMYDPHPEKPGPWFKSHFHRFLDCDDNEAEDKEPLSKDAIVTILVFAIIVIAVILMYVYINPTFIMS